MAQFKDGEITALLDSLRASGQFMQALQSEFPHSDEFELISEAGSMSDAAKRRGDELSPSDAPQMKQRPLPTRGNQEEAPVGNFPPGIDSLKTWGCTSLESGKYAKSGFTYHELSSSDDPEKKRYCTWLLSQKSRPDFNVEIKDFVKYLDAMALSDQGDQSYFPGSTVVRKLRRN